MQPAELVVMASLGCSPAQAVAELARWELALINLAHLHPVGQGIVTTQTLNVRGLPSLQGPIVAQLAHDTQVEIWGQTSDGKWLAIANPDGWVSSDLVKWVRVDHAQ